MRRLVAFGLLSLSLPLVVQSPSRGREDESASTTEAIRRGRSLFEHVWVPNDPLSRSGDGLGPVFNAQSCVSCHESGGTGGAGVLERNIEIVTPLDSTGAYAGGYYYFFSMNFGADGFRYDFSTNPPGTRFGPGRSSRRIDPNLLAAIHPGLKQAPSVVLHQFGVDPDYQVWREKIPGFHGSIEMRVSRRNPPALFGLGLLDAVPDSAIEAGAKRRSAVRGRLNRSADGRIGRFGWKAQTASLAEFVLSAAAGEIGLEVPGASQGSDPRLPGLGAKGLDLSEEDCRDLVAFTRSLDRPVSLTPADPKEASDAKSGESLFKVIGCAGCHAPKLGELEGVYSDLLLHDMGESLADTDAYGVFNSGVGRGERRAQGEGRRPAERPGASRREWRTPPLWGLRDSAPYLHDGRAPDIERAIRAHGGQAASSTARFAELSPVRRGRLLTFLKTLAAPPRTRDEPRSAATAARIKSPQKPGDARPSP